MRPRTVRGRGEQGVALVTVMLALTALLALSVAAVDYGVGSQNLSRHDQDWNAALSAAEGGVDDFVFRLNENSNYSLYNAGNPPPDGNLAFSQYVPIVGGATIAKYRYSTDTSRLTVDGTIKITATGKVGNSKRTVQATLRRRSFIDYLYFTDFETLDPARYTGSPFTSAQAQVQCAKHYYDGRNSQCIDITFISQDNINGPLHSNDATRLCGTPHFNGNTSTSWTGASGKRWRDGCPTSSPVFANAGDPKYLAPLTMPPSNSAIRAETTAGLGGCLYTGPTRITFNSAGTMTVRSPFSKNTQNGCVTNGTGALPTNGVIYVQNVPSTTTDPNFTSGCPYNVNGRVHPLGLPIANDVTTYGCRNGDVFVEGTLKGQITIASENNVDVTWNLQYNGGTSGSDLLGLVANNGVETWHPVNSSGTNLNVNFPSETARNSPLNSPAIQAAILSVNHSFGAQNYGSGSPLGTLNITGAIAQRYRGPVGQFSGSTIVHGYAKGYVYDQRLKYLSPPKFLDPIASAWGIAVWQEIKVPAGL